jgi:hypothetical protein
MSWLDDRIAEHKAIEARRKEIADNAHHVYSALWKEITEITEEPSAKLAGVYTNGAAYDRLVCLPNPPTRPGFQARSGPQLHIKLADDKQSISVSGTDRYPTITFTLDVCQDGVVCLKFDGAEFSYPDAAIKIVDPLLFPNLPRKY